ncbi:MAG: hypothetical protein LLF95_04670 [Bacteroidales bacterium]|nr:hypothetical protein [Bacteroidales bacterium]
MKKITFLLFAFTILFGCKEPVVEQIKYTVEAICDSNGTVSPTRVEVVQGEGATFTVSVNDNCYIYSILLGDNDLKSSLTNGRFTVSNVNSNLTVKVCIKKIPKEFVIRATSGSNGSISPNGEVKVKEGTNIDFSFNPINIGFELDSLKVNGKAVIPSSNVFSFSNVKSENSIDVSWKKDSVLWPLLNIIWKLDSVDIDGDIGHYPYGKYLDYSLDGVLTSRDDDGVENKTKWNLNKINSTIVYHGRTCNYFINEKILKISYINEYNQKVVMIFINERYK